ncbi:MAG: TatD family hydrolase [Bacteroidales bacterium]|nr:TatD family hydrolase [Bacteroidales bacterium]
MVLTDTHTHLYLEQFDEDREQIVQNAIDSGVNYMLLPDIDSTTTANMLELCRSYPKNCFPMTGLHPGSVKENYREELLKVEKRSEDHSFVAIGEIGIDLYWDKTFQKEQEFAFRHQLSFALGKNLPVAIHTRASFDLVFPFVREFANKGLSGIFHCFTGTIEQALKVTDLGFKLGIGGVVTFKNSGLNKVVEQVSLDHIVLETDAPFLAPVPFRGRRNESGYLKYVADKIASIKNTDLKDVADVTTHNALELFKLPR